MNTDEALKAEYNKFKEEKKLNFSLNMLFSLERYCWKTKDGIPAVRYENLLKLDYYPRPNPVIEFAEDLSMGGYDIEGIQVEDLTNGEKNYIRNVYNTTVIYFGVDNPKAVSSVTNVVIKFADKSIPIKVSAMSLLHAEEFHKFVERSNKINITVFYTKKE